MSGQYSSRLGSDGAAMASVTGLPRAPVSSSPKRAPPPGAPSADSRLDPIKLEPRQDLDAPVAEIAMFYWTICTGIVQT